MSGDEQLCHDYLPQSNAWRLKCSKQNPSKAISEWTANGSQNQKAHSAFLRQELRDITKDRKDGNHHEQVQEVHSVTDVGKEVSYTISKNCSQTINPIVNSPIKGFKLLVSEKQ